MLRVIIKLCEEADTVQRQYDIMLCCFLSYGNTIMSSLTAVNDRENQEIAAKNVVIFLTCVQRGMVFLVLQSITCTFFLRTLMTPNVVGERSDSHASVLRIVSTTEIPSMDFLVDHGSSCALLVRYIKKGGLFSGNFVAVYCLKNRKTSHYQKLKT